MCCRRCIYFGSTADTTLNGMGELLYTPTTLGDLELKNRVVMAPMTRNRAPGNVPNDLMATYYGQRSEAGLIM